MILRRLYIILIVSVLITNELWSQKDTDPPDSPVLLLVSVQPGTGFTEISWQKSIAPDVKGYIVYYFRNGEGFAFDTIYNPGSAYYVNTGSSAGQRAEAYVIASFDTANNVSPLSNPLITIFNTVKADTCRSSLNITWNEYMKVPLKVNRYKVMVSENGNPYYEAGLCEPGKTLFTLQGIKTGTKYCVIIEAAIEGDKVSSSNKTCIEAKLQKAPQWINADFATVDDDGKISLSFTFDPQSEIKKFRLERRKEAEMDYSTVADISASENNIKYKDNHAEITKRNLYRLAAINNCGITARYSNTVSNMALKADLMENMIKFSWNKCYGWRGGIAGQTIWINYGSGFEESAFLTAYDSVHTLNYSEIMYYITGPTICFYITANENMNEFGIRGISLSNTVCLQPEEKVFVPNAFTPDGDNVNDFFRPFMSFIPASFLLVVTDRNSNILFESTDYLKPWDGKRNGDYLPAGVYLWYVRITAPSGNTIRKNGTVTILRNW